MKNKKLELDNSKISKELEDTRKNLQIVSKLLRRQHELQAKKERVGQELLEKLKMSNTQLSEQLSTTRDR